MGGTTSEGGDAASTRDKTPKQHLELLHLQAEVEPDGSSARLSIHTMDGQLDLSITIEQMTATLAEMREAGAVMINRQLRSRDKGRSAFDEMIRRAPLAASVTPAVDRQTGDAVIVYRFSDRMPISVRIGQDQIFAALAAFVSELKRSSN